LSEAEWEYAARAGTATSRPWGDEADQVCANANTWDRSAFRATRPAEGKRGSDPVDCDDGFTYTAPVGRFAANRLGAHDMIGNVWEWVEDCWNATYWKAPSDGAPWQTGDCKSRAIRGGGWESNANSARAGMRNHESAGDRNANLGFRVARSLP
jgi:formylglycine-generating enzyme required for sulfatase activity